MGDLDDVNLDNPLAARRMRAIYRFWIEQVGVDGFRVDTVYYTPESFYEDFLRKSDPKDPGLKKFWLTSGSAALKNRAELLNEAGKCDVVCANCHRLRTRSQHRVWLATRTPSTAGRIESQRHRWRHRADLLDQLRSVPCADCGGVFAQCAMDFDHRDPSSKVRSVTRMINGSIEKMLAEAAKCDIVCANCHRLRTFQRRLTTTA